MKSPSLIWFFIASCLIGIFFNFSSLTVYQSVVCSGHNLYAVDATAQGKIPLKDFNWIYGPLILYYNALFFKLLGSNIHSLIIAKIILKTLFSGIYFLAARRVMSTPAALLTLLSYSIFSIDFQHNLNHYGVICMEIGLLWAILSYCENRKDLYIYFNWLFVFLIGLIKINFGLVFLLGSTFCFILCDILKHKKYSFKIHFILGSITSLLWLCIYFLLVKGLSVHEILQCFPLFGSYLYYHGNMVESFVVILKNSWNRIHYNHFHAIIASAVLLSCLYLPLYHLLKRSSQALKNILLISFLLMILIIIGYHEYLKGRQDYELYFSQPFTIFLVGYLISQACRITPLLIRIGVVIVCLWIFTSTTLNNWKFLDTCKNPPHYYNHKKLNIYSPDAPWDSQHVLRVASYIEKNVPKTTAIFTFPEASMYYFLTDRLSPSRLTYLLGATRVSHEQELGLIKDLESNKVDYIIVDNVSYFGNMWGVFGQDNCLLFFKYLHLYFEKITSFDTDPKRPSAGTVIYKRKATNPMDIEKVLSSL